MANHRTSFWTMRISLHREKRCSRLHEQYRTSCNAPTRMLVPADRHDEALNIAKTAAEKLVVGDPRDEKTDLGPVVSEAQFNKIQNLIGRAIEDGNTLVAGGLGRPNG